MHELELAIASGQRYDQGHYAAWRHAAAERLDLVLFLGDYIYEAGSPPDALHLPPGCPFEPRCNFARERCRTENPSLRPVGTDHRIACWVDVTTGRDA